jgi:hypothetical protein
MLLFAACSTACALELCGLIADGAFKLTIISVPNFGRLEQRSSVVWKKGKTKQNQTKQNNRDEPNQAHEDADFISSLLLELCDSLFTDNQVGALNMRRRKQRQF